MTTNLEKLTEAIELSKTSRERAIKVLNYAKTRSDDKEKKALINISNVIFEQSYMIDELTEMINILRFENK